VNEIVAPSQYGPPFDAVGAAGIGLTVTCVAADTLGQPVIVACTV
jgi:hypothetical protein